MSNKLGFLLIQTAVADFDDFCMFSTKCQSIEDITYLRSPSPDGAIKRIEQFCRAMIYEQVYHVHGSKRYLAVLTV